MSEQSLGLEEQQGSVVDIVEPNRPGHFLLSRLQNTKADPQLIESGAEIETRRNRLAEMYGNIETIGEDFLRRFSETYAEHGFPIRGELRFYVVGGRLTDKPLRYDSDIDCAITVEGGEDFRPLYGEEPDELIKRKRQARDEFANTALSELAEKYQFQLTEEIPSGEVVKGSLFEPKEYGTADSVFRAKGLPAVLVARYRAA